MTATQWLRSAALACALLAAPALALAQPAAKAANQCFLQADVNGFNAPDNHTVYIRVGVRDIYRLDLMTDCLDLTFRQSLGLKGSPASPWICSPLDAEIVYHETGMHEHCPVTAIHKLTPEEAAALPKKDRP